MKRNYKKYLTIVNLLLLSAMLSSCTFTDKEVSKIENTETPVEQTSNDWAEETNSLELKGGEALPIESEVEQALD
jgi:outer membrane biogenesis lipoprotein LolB